MARKARILLGMVLVAVLLASTDGTATAKSGGGKIVFARLVSGAVGTGNAELFVMNADGSGGTQLTDSPGADIEPAWAPLAYGRLQSHKT